MTLTLENDGSDQALDLGSLVLGLLAFLDDQWALDDVLANIVVLGQVEELPDLGGTLGSETTGNGAVGKAGNLGVTLLDDGQRQDGQVSVDDAAADGLALAFTGTALTVAGVTLAEKETDAAGGENSLLHGEALLVVASGDAENVTLPLLAEGKGVNLHTHTLLVEGTNLERSILLAIKK